MTREEAVENIKLIRFNAAITNANSFKEALDMAIEALSQPYLPSNLDEAAEKFNHEDAARMWDYEEKSEGEIVELAFKAGAEWQQKQIEDEHGKELLYVCQKTAEREHRSGIREGKAQAKKDLGWHSVKESLPPVDEEVIVLTDDINGKIVPGSRGICFSHRPNPDGWDGRNIDTGEVTHYVPKTYDGWNIPGVTHWMYCPKLDEE